MHSNLYKYIKIYHLSIIVIKTYTELNLSPDSGHCIRCVYLDRCKYALSWSRGEPISLQFYLDYSSKRLKYRKYSLWCWFECFTHSCACVLKTWKKAASFFDKLIVKIHIIHYLSLLIYLPISFLHAYRFLLLGWPHLKSSSHH